ncbi:MAG: IPT/TIG domain-containing protein [Acidimicrobiales bacterium]
MAVGNTQSGSSEGGDLFEWNGTTWSPPIGCTSTCTPWTNPIVTNSTIFTSISCTSTTFCMAIGYWYSSSKSTYYDNAFIWNGINLSAPTTIFSSTSLLSLSSISCPSSTFCMTIGEDGSTGEAFSWDGSTWSTLTNIDSAAHLYSVSCPSSSFCAAVDGAGNALEWKSSGGGTWTPLTDIDSTHALSSVSCPLSSSFCMAVDNAGNALEWTGSSWSTQGIIDKSYQLNSPSAISCPTTIFCMAAGYATLGPDFTDDALSWNGASWSTPANMDSSSSSSLSLTSVSCPSASFCVAVDNLGNAFEWNGTSWSPSSSCTASCSPWTNPVDQNGLDLRSVSCTSSTFCMAVDDAGSTFDNIYEWNGSAWTTVSDLTPSSTVYLDSVSCTSSTFCMVVGNDGNAFEWNGSTWSSQAIEFSSIGLSSVSCPSSSFCMAVDYVGNAFEWNGTSWSPSSSCTASCSPWTNPVNPSSNLTSVSCASTTFCAAVGNIGATKTTFGKNSYAIEWSGGSWSSPVEIGQSDGGVSAVSCPSSSLCQAVDASGSILTWSTATTPTPTISSISPTLGLGAGGSVVTITGTGFSTAPDGTTVDFLGRADYRAAYVTCSSSTTCTVITPANVKLAAGTAEASPVSVSTPGGTSGYSTSVRFIYTSSPYNPTITSFSPTSGPASGGTSVTIMGTNFLTASASTIVDFGSTPATSVTCSSTTSCTGVSPTGTGTVSVTVATSAGTSNGVSFTYTSAIPPPPIINPTRICDTRPGNPSNLSGIALTQCENKPIGPASTLAVQVAGLGGVPKAATGAYLNVTTLGDTTTSYLDIYPAGASRSMTSQVSITSPNPEATLAFVPLSSSGGISIYNHSGSVQVVIDVEGYTMSSAAGKGGSLYNETTPTRICDTRPGNPSNLSGTALTQCEGHAPPVGGTLVISIPGLPLSATAAVLNLTVTGSSGAGFLTVYAVGSGQPAASDLNFVGNSMATVSNIVTVPVADGKVAVYASASTQIIIDLEGYYAASGATLHSVTPTRICDTRSGNPSNLSGTALTQCEGKTLRPGSTLTIATVGNGLPIPAGAKAVVVSVTVTNETQPGYLTLDPVSIPPDTSDLNWAEGVTTTHLAIVQLADNGSFTVYNSAGSTDVVVDVVGYAE